MQLHRALRQPILSLPVAMPTTVKKKELLSLPGGRQSAHLPLVEAAMLCGTYVGAATELRYSGNSNSNIPISKGIPAVTVGGSRTNYHSHSASNEYFCTEEAYRLPQGVFLLMLMLSKSDLAILKRIGADNSMIIKILLSQFLPVVLWPIIFSLILSSSLQFFICSLISFPIVFDYLNILAVISLTIIFMFVSVIMAAHKILKGIR